MDKDEREVIDTAKLTLEEWLNLLRERPQGKIYKAHEFPTDQHYEEYMSTIDNRTEKEIRWLLLHFLMPTGSLGADVWRLEGLIAMHNSMPEMYERALERVSTKRLILYASGANIPPWEGNTWVLDLLPHWPHEALAAVEAYILAHAQQLPDGRYGGLYDAMAIIRARYIGIPANTQDCIELLQSLNSRQFECLVERLYSAMGYKTVLTPRQKDGGRDVIAESQAVGRREMLQIECKRYREPVGVTLVRTLLGVVSDTKSNKGVLVTTSRFTKDALTLACRNPRVELIDGITLVNLLNEHLGPRWPGRIDSLVIEAKPDSNSDASVDDQSP